MPKNQANLASKSYESLDAQMLTRQRNIILLFRMKLMLDGVGNHRLNIFILEILLNMLVTRTML